MNAVDSLIYATAVLAFAYGAGWALAPRLLHLAPPTALAFMLCNILIALSLGQNVVAGEDPGMGAQLATIAWALLGLAAARAGIQTFLRLPSAWREGAVVVLAALALAFALRQGGAAQNFYPLPLALAIAYLVARLCVTSFAALRRDFSVLESAAVLAPFVAWAIWQLARAGWFIGAGDGEPAPALLGSVGATLAPAWATLVALLGMNMACLGLVIARMLQHLRELTLRDGLTGIMNRRAIEMSLASEYEKLRRHGQIFCVSSIDLDRFRRVHDEFGRAASDAALFHAVQVIKGQLRNCDALGRVGDEEFLVIFPMTRLHGGREAAERIRSALANSPFAWDGRSVSVTASLGVAECFNPEEPAPTLLRRTDHALFSAKNGGRNRVDVAPN